MSIELCTAHYVFHCQGNSTAEKRIEEIAALQEGCYRFISSCLKTDAKGKIMKKTGIAVSICRIMRRQKSGF